MVPKNTEEADNLVAEFLANGGLVTVCETKKVNKLWLYNKGATANSVYASVRHCGRKRLTSGVKSAGSETNNPW